MQKLSRTLLVLHPCPSASRTPAFQCVHTVGYPHRYPFRGSITRPVSSLPPAPYGPLRGGTRVRYGPAGQAVIREDLPPAVLTYWGTPTSFMNLRPLPRFRADLGASTPGFGAGLAECQASR